MDKSSNTRKYIRFEPDSGDFVQIDREVDRHEFLFQEAALLVDESAGGFSVVCLRSLGFVSGQCVRVKVGRMAPLKAESVWIRELDDKVVRMGFRFLE